MYNYDVWRQFLDESEEKEFLKAKKAFDDKDYSLCRKICDNIVYNVDETSRRSYELLLEASFLSCGVRQDCIGGILYNEPKEETIEEIFKRFISYNKYIERYLFEFDDFEAKSFILQFKERITNVYNITNSKKMPIEHFLNKALSERNVLYFSSGGDSTFLIFKVGDYYCKASHIGYDWPILAFKLSLGIDNIELNKIIIHAEEYYGAWGKKYRYVSVSDPVKLALDPFEKFKISNSNAVDNCILINGFVYVLEDTPEWTIKFFQNPYLNAIADELKKRENKAQMNNRRRSKWF